MNRVINNPDLVVEDMLQGILAAHPELVAADGNPRVIQRACAPVAGKVGIVTGGGSGHEPAFLGYVGENLVDAVAVGEIFSSPTAKSFFDAIKAADGGAGVACLYGNYAGDNMNVKMAMKMAERAGIAVKTVVANDDVPSAPKGDEAKRRGVAGEILMWKTASACAAQGGSLEEVIAVAQKTIFWPALYFPCSGMLWSLPSIISCTRVSHSLSASLMRFNCQKRRNIIRKDTPRITPRYGWSIRAQVPPPKSWVSG